MTAAFLQSELTSLISDSKRRQSDVRTAAEKSLADLKSIQVTSETQLAGDLLRQPNFIEPFVLACNSKYVKLALTGAICLQRLIASKAITTSRIADVLDAFQEATQQGFDVQLKILQALPSLLQLYTSDLRGGSLSKTLSLCAGLAGSKTPLVSSTANATFQQLISALFERHIANETSREDGDHENNTDGDTEDVAAVFSDMCMVVGGEQPQFLRPQGLTTTLALEVIEVCLSNSNVVVLDISGCLTTCETVLMPGLGQILEKSSNYNAFGRSLRILYLLISNDLERMLNCINEAFVSILHIMDRPSGPPWRRILCLEFMRGIVSDPQLFRKLYALFDCDAVRTGLISNLMSVLVRIAAEDPALIGLGRQSTIPTNTEDDNLGNGGAAVDVDTVGSVVQASSNVTGISSRWSTMGTPLLEQLDKVSIPEIPATYIYTLVLGIVASLSDGLSKFVMPLSVPSRGTVEGLEVGDIDGVPARRNSQVRRSEKYQRLLNPLKREGISSSEEVQMCAKLIEDCWPAVLATCSTFLNSALDSYFYHILVRTVQKLAQVSGVLELFTPRDALLTTLAKVSVPVNASSFVTALYANKLAKVARDDDDDESENSATKASISTTPRLSVDVSKQPLNVRNLLCLRALLNLGIALGPTLSNTSWFIIIQALQQADALMSVNPTSRASISRARVPDEADVEGQANLGTEIMAVATASKRMLESTKIYSNDAFEILVHSIFKMIESLFAEPMKTDSGINMNGNQTLKAPARKHNYQRSVSGSQPTAMVLHIEAEFVLRNIGDLVRVNLHRFCSTSTRTYTWDLIAVKLIKLVGDVSLDPQLRLQAASIIDAIATDTAKVLEKHHDTIESSSLQGLYLSILLKQFSHLYKCTTIPIVLATDVEIHRRLLEALENIISNSGDSLTTGWKIVFEVLEKTTRQTKYMDDDISDSSSQPADQEAILGRTLPSAFRSVQLIVSDFLNTIDPNSFAVLVQLLPLFGSQKHDLNVALTTTALFSNLSSLLLERTESVDVPPKSPTTPDPNSDDISLSGRKITDVSSLWFDLVIQLCRLCKDERVDIRNSALRVLVRILETASSQMTPNTWNVIFNEALLPILEHYSLQEQHIADFHLSYTQCVEGIGSLFAQNVQAIVQSEHFAEMWNNIILTFTTKLSKNTLEGHAVVLSTVAELLRALETATVLDDKLLFPVLQLWAENHPAEIISNEKSNQDSLCAHGQLLSVILAAPEAVIGKFSVARKGSVELTLTACKQSVLSSVHPPYSSDVTRLSPEQKIILDNLRVIKRLMASNKQDYTKFILDLILDIFTRNTSVEVEKQKIGSGTRHLKRPTLLALMSECITDFRSIIEEESSKAELMLGDTSDQALPILSGVVATKYTSISTNADAPVWQNATYAITELTEMLAKRIVDLHERDVASVSQRLVQTLTSILTAPALEGKSPPPSATSITSDEAFDIEQFKQFHNASLHILKQSRVPQPPVKQYVLVLLQASFIAKPWFGDLPPDLPNKPLSTFTDVRPGTIKSPDYLPRTKIPYEAFEALIMLIDSQTPTTSNPDPTTVAKIAAPYILLRIAHTIKVFLADQRLRNLTPPPASILRELNTILSRALNLRCIKGTFDDLMSPSHDDESPPVNPASARLGYDDGKDHLRILYPLVLRLKEFWVKLPRSRICAWQDGEDGLAVKKLLDEWGHVLARTWEVRLED